MSWYDSAWPVRIPALVDKLTAGTSAVDVTIIIPADLSEFWDNVDDAGDDIRVTAADGTTLLTHDLSGWSYANRTVTIELQGVTPPIADCMFVVWIYVGNAAATSTAVPFAPASARAGMPISRRPAGDVYRGLGRSAGSTRPGHVLQLTSLEEVRPWVLLSDLLHEHAVPYEGHGEAEEVQWVRQLVTQDDVAGVAQDDATRYDETQLRLSGRGAIRCHVHDGILTAGGDYTLSLLVGTTEGRILNPRILLQVRNPDDET